MTTLTDPTVPTADGLQRVVEQALGGPHTVESLQRLTGGSSREIWQFRATSAATGDRDLILRRDPPGEVRPEGARLEYDAMRAARRAGVTVPEILALVPDTDPDLPGGGLIMDLVVGEARPRRILTAPDLDAARQGLGPRCGTELGRLHAIDPAVLPGAPVESRLSAYRAELDRLDPNRPVLELAGRWLLDHRPPPRPPVLVHGDFRLGNLMVDTSGLVAVLDWESVHVGDRLEDLGWIAVKAWRFRGPGVIGGVGDVDPFLTAYRAETGVTVEPEEFRWGLVLGTWIWAVGCLAQADRHLSGTTRSVDLAVTGRRVAEIEYDLLELLA